MARLDKTFPTGDCATCIISPKLVECMRDYNIDVLTMADVAALEGEAGHFAAEVRKRPRSVDADKCTGCGDCWTVCPVRNTAAEPAAVPAERAARPKPTPPGSSEILARHEGDPGSMMPVLQEINQSYGYLPRGMLEHLACLLGTAAGRDPPRGQLLRPLSPASRSAATWSRSARARPATSRGSRTPAEAAGEGTRRRAPARPTSRGGSRCGRSAASACAPCRRP